MQQHNEVYNTRSESKEKRGENSDFLFLGRTFVGKSKNKESSLNLNNSCQISIQLAGLT